MDTRSHLKTPPRACYQLRPMGQPMKQYTFQQLFRDPNGETVADVRYIHDSDLSPGEQKPQTT